MYKICYNKNGKYVLDPAGIKADDRCAQWFRQHYAGEDFIQLLDVMSAYEKIRRSYKATNLWYQDF